MTSPAYQLQVEVEQKHFADLLRASRRRMYSAWRRYGLMFVPPFVAGGTGAWLAIVDGYDGNLGMGIGALSWLAAYLATYFISCVPRPQVVEKGGMALGPVDLVFDGTGVAYRKPNYQSLMRWSGILDFYEQPNTFLLMTDRTAAILVPKSAFDTEQEAEAFRDYVTEKCDLAKSEIGRK